MTVLPQLEAELQAAHARLAGRNRLVRAWLARRVQAPDATGAGPALRPRVWLGRSLAAVPVLFAVGTTVVVAVIALSLGHRHGSSSGRGGGLASGSDRSQAQQLYAPVVTFNRATTDAQRAQMRAAPKAAARRINSCQAPYAKQLFSGLTVGSSSRYKLYTLYENGALLEQNQAVEAVVAPQLTAAEKAWATMRLPNPTLQNYARAQAAELAASLFAPRSDTCQFLPQLAQHKFSYAWAIRSSFGTTATHFFAQVAAAGNAAGNGWRYIHNNHLLATDQQSVLVNFAGQIS